MLITLQERRNAAFQQRLLEETRGRKGAAIADSDELLFSFRVCSKNIDWFLYFPLGERGTDLTILGEESYLPGALGATVNFASPLYFISISASLIDMSRYWVLN